MIRYLLSIVALGAIASAIAWNEATLLDDATAAKMTVSRVADDAPADGESTPAHGPKQILKNEEMMKLLFDPYYVDLRNAIGEEPEGRAEWRQAYIAIFRISEVTNLLYSRKDKDYMLTEEWGQMATESRDAAEGVGQAVLKLDYPLVRERYERLIQTCNDCHTKFEPEKATEVKAWNVVE